MARKEYGEFSNNIDLIDVLPPGLYEAVFEAKRDDTASPDLVTGDWIMRCEARTLDDIRALGGNDAADERRFATAARVSEINLALYRTFAQPMVRAMVSSRRPNGCGGCIRCGCNTSCCPTKIRDGACRCDRASRCARSASRRRRTIRSWRCRRLSPSRSSPASMPGGID